MYKRFLTIFTAFVIAGGILISAVGLNAQDSLQLEVNIISIAVCGNNIKETGEQCDGTDLGGMTCQNLGYSGGTLSCKTSCEFNTSACTPAPAGGGVYVAPITSVVFSGRAYPNSAITVLKDAQIATTSVADANANFQITLSGLSAGNYIFGIYAKDNQGRSSPLLIFPKNIISGTTTYIRDIIIPPPIEEKLPIKGDLNNDHSVNLVDLSILIYWFDKIPVPPKVDLNNDGKADLTDLSIMAYYWTG